MSPVILELAHIALTSRKKLLEERVHVLTADEVVGQLEAPCSMAPTTLEAAQCVSNHCILKLILASL